MCDIGEIVKIGNSGVFVLFFDSVNVECLGYIFLEVVVSGEILDVLYNLVNWVIIVVFVFNINWI